MAALTVPSSDRLPDEEFEQRAMLYLDGEMSPEDKAAFEAHLAGDPERAKQVEALRSINAALGDIGQAILDEPIPDRLIDVLRGFPPDTD